MFIIMCAVAVIVGNAQNDNIRERKLEKKNMCHVFLSGFMLVENWLCHVRQCVRKSVPTGIWDPGNQRIGIGLVLVSRIRVGRFESGTNTIDRVQSCIGGTHYYFLRY